MITVALVLNKPALVFLAALMLVMCAGLRAGRQRCGRCGRGGPMVGSGRDGGFICHRHKDES